jgi:hypothetical protein
MKKITTFILSAIISSSAFAQQFNDYLEVSREVLRTEKKALITEVMQLTEEEGKDFCATSGKINVKVDWNQVICVLKTSATLQVVPNPAHLRGSSLHDPLWGALRYLQADYVRYIPWGLYPELMVAELQPPKEGKTTWDLSLIDTLLIDFLEATEGRSFIMNFSAIPEWMFKTPKPATPAYELGSMFRDPSGKEVADYFARIVSWYTKGGFRDELGVWHHSGHHYKIDYWEVLNEPDHEDIGMTPELYTTLYDLVVQEIRKVAPEMKFVGLAMASTWKAPKWLKYFLDLRNHKPGIPIDMVSYHLYVDIPADKNSPEAYPLTVFRQAEKRLIRVQTIDSIRQRLLPQTQTAINEIGILFSNVPDGWGNMNGESIPSSFWNLSAAYFAYVYAGLALQGIEIVGQSTLWADQDDWPEVSLLDWKTGQPNARYWVLKLIRENFGPGDNLVGTDVDSVGQECPVYAQGFVTRNGDHKVLLVNKSNRTFDVSISGTAEGRVRFVDQSTGHEPPASISLKDSSVKLRSFAVAVVTLTN